MLGSRSGTTRSSPAETGGSGCCSSASIPVPRWWSSCPPPPRHPDGFGSKSAGLGTAAVQSVRYSSRASRFRTCPTSSTRSSRKGRSYRARDSWTACVPWRRGRL